MRFKTVHKKSDSIIPLQVPCLSGPESKYLKECLDTNFVSSVGPFVDRFERMLADYVGMKHAVATMNGTAALHIALLVAGIQPDEEILVPSLTFIAPANAIRYVGAWPVFMDADPISWQMDTNKTQRFLEEECKWVRGKLLNKKTRRQIKAILPVHILGHSCDMDPLLKLARKFKLIIIEDAAESLGAKYKGKSVGSFGDIACFSFNGNKIITAGGGGMIVTNHQKWAERAKYLTTQAKDDPLEYIHKEAGYNYRLPNLLAAVGCAQMEQIDQFISVKRRLATLYDESLKTFPGIRTLKEVKGNRGVFWLYTILIDKALFGSGRRDVLRKLAAEGIQTRPLWQPLHQSQPYNKCFAYDCHHAQTIYAQALSLPSSVGLKKKDLQRVVSAIRACSKEKIVSFAARDLNKKRFILDVIR